MHDDGVFAMAVEFSLSPLLTTYPVLSEMLIRVRLKFIYLRNAQFKRAFRRGNIARWASTVVTITPRCRPLVGREAEE